LLDFSRSTGGSNPETLDEATVVSSASKYNPHVEGAGIQNAKCKMQNRMVPLERLTAVLLHFAFAFCILNFAFTVALKEESLC